MKRFFVGFGCTCLQLYVYPSLKSRDLRKDLTNYTMYKPLFTFNFFFKNNFKR